MSTTPDSGQLLKRLPASQARKSMWTSTAILSSFWRSLQLNPQIVEFSAQILGLESVSRSRNRTNTDIEAGIITDWTETLTWNRVNQQCQQCNSSPESPTCHTLINRSQHHVVRRPQEHQKFEQRFESPSRLLCKKNTKIQARGVSENNYYLSPGNTSGRADEYAVFLF